jgi:hypothetical protein
MEELTRGSLEQNNYQENLKKAFDSIVLEKVCRIKDSQIVSAKFEHLKNRRDRLLKSYKKTRNIEVYLEARKLGIRIKKGFK